jgi:predicted AAA+ superfamily ATPase
METLRAEHNLLLQGLANDTLFKRTVTEEIGWEERLLFIKGARGIGKTTLILQRIMSTFKFDERALYVSMDNIALSNKTLVEIATEHYNHGGTHLFIDEIHKYQNWSLELNNIYDKYKKFHVVASGSSILELYKGNADLSRRGVTHVLYGLSLREYVNSSANQNIKKYALNEILNDHVSIANDILKAVNPLKYFKDYLMHGYYPFYLEGTKYFHQKLNTAINQIIEVDIPRIYNIDICNTSKVKKLLYLIAVSVPFQPNSTKLAESLDVSRQTLNTYLNYLEEGQILQLLWNSQKSYSLISKPDKIYLQNPNLCYLIPSTSANIGNLRETFFMNQVSTNHKVNTSVKGDFLVDDKIVFEIGGNNKSFKQIADLPDSYVGMDNELIGSGKRIPLWLLGFLY